MNPLILGALIASFTDFSKNKNFPYVILGLLLLFFYAWYELVFEPVQKVREGISEFIDKLFVTDAELLEVERKTKITKYFDYTWYRNIFWRAVEKMPIAQQEIIDGNLLTETEARIIAENLHNAKGLLNDDELEVYLTISTLPTKGNLGYVANIFYSMYNIPLLKYLKTFLNNSEMLNVYDYANELPNDF